MAVVAISDSILTDIADAIRSKNGTENTYKPAQMPDAIEAISSGGITPTGTIEITQNGVVDVTNYASADVDVPSVTPALGTKTITQNGTYDAEDDSLDGYSEVTVNVSGGGGYDINDLATNAEPSGAVTITASTINGNAFSGKANITSVSAPNATSIGSYAFSGCKLASASFPSVTSVSGGYIFGTSHTFTTIDGNMFPLLATCNINMFNADTKTTAISLPSWTGLGYTSQNGTNHFRGMTNLVTLNLPECVHIGGYECYGDTKLTSVLLGKTSTYSNAKYICTNSFNGCTKMNVLVLYGNVIWTLNNINAFTNTPFASGKAGGTLYVPSAMISSYESASNWSTLLGYSTNNIVAIEGSAYE